MYLKWKYLITFAGNINNQVGMRHVLDNRSLCLCQPMSATECLITKTGSQKIKFSPTLISTSKNSTSLANIFHYDEVLEDDH